ncbi:MAG: hypothetical protein HRU30_12060 [Rhodobacteraceae bacterium]|nr:hypothetical protein [Paracoccaceae bacterium]
MEVIGLCRFSYPALGGFQVEHDSIEDRKAYLWSEARLEERFRLMETIALPCLRAQTDPEFTFVILIGDDFPNRHSDRLHDLVSGMPQVHIVAEPPRNNREVAKDLLNQARAHPDKPCIQFRYDDDDAVAVDFVEKARQAAKDTKVLAAKHVSIAFDWQQGYVAELDHTGISAAPIQRALNTAALGMFISGGSTRTIHNFAHHKISRFMPVVSFNDPDMYVRTHNGFNDSRQTKAKQVNVSPLTKAQETLFHERFAIDLDHLRSVFGAA